MAPIREEDKSRWWWFESHKSTKHSQWLQSTLAELDAKTKAMLKLIEGNADSFAQLAETYYKKRPELISFVEDFYRAHRSLAERFDHLKSSENGTRSPKFLQDNMESVCDSNSEFEDADSEIEDPDQDHELERQRLESEALRSQLLEKDEEKREVIRQLALAVESLKDENSRLKRRLGVGDETLKKASVFEFKPFDKFLGKLFYATCDGKRIV